MAGNQKRFWLEDGKRGDEFFCEDEKWVHKLKNVLRLKIGEVVRIFDGSGKEWEVEILKLKKGSFEGKVLREIFGEEEKNCEVILWQGIPKKAEKLELVCEKVTELGAVGIGFLDSENGVKKEVKKMERLKKIVIEACEQSGRRTVPEILGVKNVEEVLRMEGEKVMLDERGENELEGFEGVEKVILMVGSEGGFSEKEVKMGKKMGVKICKMGELTLRTETAGIVGMGILRLLTCQKK